MTTQKRKHNQDKVLPGIEPGLPEITQVIRIWSDNRYTTKPLNEDFPDDKTYVLQWILHIIVTSGKACEH
jgi:hypothetical protein